MVPALNKYAIRCLIIICFTSSCERKKESAIDSNGAIAINSLSTDSLVDESQLYGKIYVPNNLDSILVRSKEIFSKSNYENDSLEIRKLWEKVYVVESLKGNYQPIINFCDSLLRNNTVFLAKHITIKALLWRLKGLSYRKLNMFNESLTSFDSAIVLIKQTTTRENMCGQLMFEKFNLLVFSFEDYNTAFSIASEAISTIQLAARPDTGFLLKLTSNISVIYSRLNQSDSALHYANKTDQLFHNHPPLDPLSEMVICSNVGPAFHFAGRYDKASYYLDNAFKMTSEVGSDPRMYDAYYNYASLKMDIGDPEGAMPILFKEYNRLNDIIESIKKSGSVEYYCEKLANACDLLGLGYALLSDKDSALLYQTLALENYKISSGVNSTDVAVAYNNIAETHISLTANWDSVYVYSKKMKESLPKDDPQYNWFYEYQYLPKMTLALAMKQNIDSSQILLQRVQTKFYATFNLDNGFDWNNEIDPVNSLTILNNLLKSNFVLYNKTKNTDFVRNIKKLYTDFNVVSNFLINNVDEQYLIKIIQKKQDVNFQMFGLFVDSTTNHPISDPMLLTIFEEQKSLLMKRKYIRADAGGLLNENITYQIQKLKIRKKKLLEEKADMPEAVFSTKQKELVTINTKLDSLINLKEEKILVNRNIDFGLMKQKFVSLKKDNTAILNFAIHQNELYILTIFGNDYFFREVALGDNFNQAFGSAFYESTTPSFEFSNALYTKIVETSLKGFPEATSLIIIPDGNLSNLSFEALVSYHDKDSVRYLGDNYNIRYEYCMSFLLNKRKEKTQSEGILAFAPKFEKPTIKPNDNLFAAVNKSLLQNQPGIRAGIGPLKYNIEEVNEINSHFKGTDLISQDATEAAFRNYGEKYNVLHFATHAFSNVDNSDLSGIVLQVNNSDSVAGLNTSFEYNDSLLEIDNILHAYEIQNMNLSADLVVLSACETNTGKYQSGEGAMSLARTFKYANCPNVVSSLWKVDDASTKEIMVNFYDNLGKSMGKADALAEAKRTFRIKHPNASPFYWAAFILIGDNEPVHLERKSNKIFWFSGGVLVLLIATFAARRRKIVA